MERKAKLSVFSVFLIATLACASSPSQSDIETAIAQTQGVGPATEAAGDQTEEPTDLPTQEPTEEPTATPAGSGTTRTNPAAPGTEIRVGDYTISDVEGVRPGDAVVEAENMFNAKAAAGNEYLLVRVWVKCEKGPDETCESHAIRLFRLITADGNVLTPGTLAGDNLLGKIELFGGATAKGMLAFEVSKTETDFTLMITSPDDDELREYLAFDIATAN